MCIVDEPGSTVADEVILVEDSVVRIVGIVDD